MHTKHAIVTSILALAATVSSGVQAAEYQWDTHDTVEVALGLTPSGTIYDTFDFSLNEPSVLYAAAVANNLNLTFGVDDGLVSLLRATGDRNEAELVGSFSFNGTSGDITHGFGQLAAGDYFYRVTGMATGHHGGVYSITSEVGPVPEPATLAMVSAAAALLFLVLRRRDL